jgi:hypothetical protein
MPDLRSVQMSGNSRVNWRSGPIGGGQFGMPEVLIWPRVAEPAPAEQA